MIESFNIVPVREAEIAALRDISEETFIEAFASANDPVHFKTYIDKAFTLAQISREWHICLLYTSPSPRDATLSRMPSSA